MCIHSRTLKPCPCHQQPELVHASPQCDPTRHPVSAAVHVAAEPSQGEQNIRHRSQFALNRETEYLQLQLVETCARRGSVWDVSAQLAHVQQSQRHHAHHCDRREQPVAPLQLQILRLHASLEALVELLDQKACG